MNEQIEKMVEEFYEHNSDITSDWLRAALTSAYNAGLERAKEVVNRVELKSQYGIKDEVVEFYDGAVRETRDVILAAIEKEKLTDSRA